MSKYYVGISVCGNSKRYVQTYNNNIKEWCICICVYVCIASILIANLMFID